MPSDARVLLGAGRRGTGQGLKIKGFMPAVSFQAVSKTFVTPKGPFQALNQVNLDLPGADKLGEKVRRRLLGRYGAEAPALAAAAEPSELEAIPGTNVLWAELRWAARSEFVEHLDDLLLRRVRLGLLAPQGGIDQLDKIRAIVQPELGWSDARWKDEAQAYIHQWQTCYYLPGS